MKDNNTFKSSEEELSEDDILKLLKEKLCANEWFTQEEIEKYFTDEICECIRECTSPDKTDIFNAFDGLPPKKVKVLIMGKDPYPNKKKAHGLAFSHKKGNIPAENSLNNIFCKILRELRIDNEFTDLTSWKEQGVLLLNTALTYVNSKNEKKHINAWNPFINLIISKLIECKIEDEKPLVIMLWGKEANKFYCMIKDKNYPFSKILCSSHPSNLTCNKPIRDVRCRDNIDLSIPAFNDRSYKPFKECNEFLGEKEAIDWHTK